MSRAADPSSATERGQAGASAAVAAGGIYVIVGVCCAAPLLWMIVSVLARPHVLGQLAPTSFRVGLFFRTVLYNGSAAMLACLLSIPAAMVIGRGRGWIARLMLIALPVALIMPSICYTYGWIQVFRIVGMNFKPAGAADVFRCIWMLACWLWPVPAVAVGLSLRSMDSEIQQQAIVDGGLRRVTARLLAGPMLAAGAIVFVLSLQEFAVYEKSGISVIATEVRTVFETGASSLGSSATIAGVVAGSGLADQAQAQRAAAAIATGLPALMLIAVLVLVAFRFAVRLPSPERVDVEWPKVLNASTLSVWLAMMVVGVTLVIPTIAMVASISPQRWRTDSAGHVFFVRVWLWAEPYALGSLLYGALAAAGALVLAILATVRRAAVGLVIALAAFLVGGELLAIADIRLFSGVSFIYGKPPAMMIAYLGQFGWLALLAGRLTWGRSYRELRDMAAVDGAGPWRAALHVIVPIGGAMLIASAALVMVLSMTEVSATVLLSPARPQTLVVLLMGFIHQLRYDDMLEGCLLLMGMAVVISVAAVLLVRKGSRAARSPRRRRLDPGAGILLLAMGAAVFPLCGCDDRSKPSAVWCETGTDVGQLIYPRGIAYSSKDDCFFIVDRTARIQRIDASGKGILQWRMPEWKDGKPIGLCVGPDGNLYVADTHYARIMVYGPNGTFLRRWGSLGKGLGQFIFPTAVAFDSAGNVYVSEYGDNDRIQVFDPTASRVLRTIGRFGNRDGEFIRPESMVILGDLLYVADSSNHRVVVFRTDGAFVKNIGGVGTELGEFRFPYGLALDGKQRLVVSEYGNNRVQLVDPETGKGLSAWGVAGREPGQLAYPWAVAVDKRGRVVVVDSGNNRLQVFSW